MIRFWFTSCGLACLAVLPACTDRSVHSKMPASAMAALEGAEKLELFSLDPDLDQRINEAAGEKVAGEHFHGWKVLRWMQLTDRLERLKILQAFKKASTRVATRRLVASNPDTASE